MIKVSLIVPIYNAEEYLEKCMNSLINQSLNEIEIILINDGSNDKSDNIVKSYNDKRIIYKSKENEGIGKTRNQGIKLANGEFIAFVDADDSISLDFCEKMYNKAKAERCDMIVCDYYNNKDNNYEKIRLKEFLSSSLEENPGLINSINLGPCNKLFKLKMIKNNKVMFPENIKYEDVPFVCHALMNSKKICKLNEALCYFTIHSGSQTTVRNDKIFDILNVVENIKTILNNDVYQEELKKLIIPMILDYAVQTRFIKDKIIRNSFIDCAFIALDKTDKNWKKYIKKNSWFKLLVLKNKTLLKFYCAIYSKRGLIYE